MQLRLCTWISFFQKTIPSLPWILPSALVVAVALSSGGCSAFSDQNEFLTHLQSKPTPTVKGTVELDPDMTRCNALAREARIYYRMCELGAQPPKTLGGQYKLEAACTIGERLRQDLSKSIGKEVLRIESPPDADELKYIYEAKLYNGIILGPPTEKGVKRAIARFSKVPADCSSSDSLGKASQNPPADSDKSRQLRESYPMLRDLNSNVTPGVQGTIVVDRDFANCSKAARETFIYHGFCQMKRAGAPGWFPPDACERAEKARKLLSLALGKEVVNIDGVGRSGDFLISPSRKGAPVSSADIERFIDEFTSPPAECRPEGR